MNEAKACVIAIRMENAAFDENPCLELARILKELAEDIESKDILVSKSIKDFNGNTIGTLTVV